MKKGMKILIGVLLVIGIGIGGFVYMQHREHEKMVQIATSKEAKKVYEEFIKTRDPKAFTEEGIIQAYEVDKSSLKYNPMGGLMVTVIINNKAELDIGYNLIENEDGTYSSAYYSVSAKLAELLGDPNNVKKIFK